MAIRSIFTRAPRTTAGILAGALVLWVVHGIMHGLAPATGFGLAAFLVVTANRPQRALQPRLLPVLGRHLLTVAAYLLVLAVAATVFKSLAAGVAFGICTLYVLDRYWPAPRQTSFADIVTTGVYLALAAVWIWLTHGDEWLIWLLAAWAAVTLIARHWAAPTPGRTRPPDQPQWPRSIGPRPLV